MREWPYTASNRDELGCTSPPTSIFPQPARCPSGFALGTSLGPREIFWSSGMYNPIHPSSRQCTQTMQMIVKVYLVSQHFLQSASKSLLVQNRATEPMLLQYLSGWIITLHLIIITRFPIQMNNSNFSCQCDPVKEGGSKENSEEGSSLQPWQIYSGTNTWSQLYPWFNLISLISQVFSSASGRSQLSSTTSLPLRSSAW